MMAYVLRTSPSAIKLMAERRGTPWPTHINLDDEEVQMAQPLRALNGRRWWGPIRT